MLNNIMMFDPKQEAASRTNLNRQDDGWKRRMAEQLSRSSQPSTPIRHWSQGAAKLVDGAVSGMMFNKMEVDNKANQAADDKSYADLYLPPTVQSGNLPPIQPNQTMSKAPVSPPITGGLMQSKPAPISPLPLKPTAATSAPDMSHLDNAVMHFEAGGEGKNFQPQWDYKQTSYGYGTKYTKGADTSPEGAKRAMQADLATRYKAVSARFPNATEGQKIALTDLHYNVGGGYMKNSGLARAMDRGDTADAARRLALYTKAGGKTLPGLVKRRAWDVATFNGQTANPQGYGGGGTTVSANGGRKVPRRPEFSSKQATILRKRLQNPKSRLSAQRHIQQMQMRQGKYDTLLQKSQFAQNQPISQMDQANLDFKRAQTAKLERESQDTGTSYYQKNLQKHLAKSQAQATVALPGIEMSSKRILSQIDQVINHPYLASATGVQGYFPSIRPGVKDVDSRISQLQGAAFLQAFEALKGGGTITNIEGMKAEQALARLRDATVGDANYLTALKDFRSAVQDIVKLGRAKASGTWRPVQPQQPQQGQPQQQGQTSTNDPLGIL